MPRYLVETVPVPDAVWGAAQELATRRFPELAIERRSADPAGRPDRWACRAPSEAHVRRWADAAHLTIESLSRADVATARGEGGRGG